MSKISTVVVLAAGKGTRLYPFTSVIPKALYPLIDRPVIQYVLEEAIVPGIRNVVLVTPKDNGLIVEYLRQTNDQEFRKLLSSVQLVVVEQPQKPYGSGAALLAAREHLMDGPFLVCFGDSFALPHHGRITSLIKTYRNYHSPIICLIPISKRELGIYGIPKIKGRVGENVLIEGIIEKPGQEYTGELLAAPNGYIVTPDVFLHLERLRPTPSGEISFPESLNVYWQSIPVYGDIFEGPFFEAGNKSDVVRSSIAMMPHRKDLMNLQDVGGDTGKLPRLNKEM